MNNKEGNIYPAMGKATEVTVNCLHPGAVSIDGIGMFMDDMINELFACKKKGY